MRGCQARTSMERNNEGNLTPDLVQVLERWNRCFQEILNVQDRVPEESHTLPLDIAKIVDMLDITAYIAIKNLRGSRRRRLKWYKIITKEFRCFERAQSSAKYIN